MQVLYPAAGRMQPWTNNITKAAWMPPSPIVLCQRGVNTHVWAQWIVLLCLRHAPHPWSNPCPPNSTSPPLPKLASLVPTVFYPPHYSRTPFAPSFRDNSNFQSLAGPPTLNLRTLLLYSPGSQPWVLVSFSGLQRGGQKGCHSSAVIWRYVVGAARCNVGWWGLNLAVALSLC